MTHSSMARPRVLLPALLFAGACLASSSALASGLQVSPVSLTLQANQNADGLWLSNTGDDVVHAQVRVYHWTQPGDKDVLTPSQGLVISPPMVEIPPGQRQLVRVIRVGAPPNGADAVEDAYRLAVDELPIDVKGKTGLQFVLHYSAPVFVEPAASPAVAPQLHWQVRLDGQHVTLQVSNSGNGHAQLAGLDFVDRGGHRTAIDGGLVGYVLPGATMHWTLKLPAADFAGGGTIEARINGAQATQVFALAARTH